MSDETLQEQLKLMHEDLLSKFLELKNDNDAIKSRLSKIEAKLGVGKPLVDHEGQKEGEVELVDEVEQEKKTKDKTGEPSEEREEAKETKVKEGLQVKQNITNLENFDDEELQERKDDSEEEDEEIREGLEEDVGKRHVVQLEKLAKSTFKGFCFRPLAAWKNSSGKYEISKEHVRIGEDEMELRLSGCDSGEEIAKIIIPLKDVEKVEAYFDTKTVLYLYVGEDICEAASQSLAMTNIASFSLIDEVAKRIRICFEGITDDRKALLREYFRRNAIYFKIICRTLHDKIFFKPVQKPVPPKYDSNKPAELDDFVNTIKTFRYLDRITYTCKVCEYYNENKDTVIRHVSEFHIEPRRRLSDKEIVSQYIESNESDDERWK